MLFTPLHFPGGSAAGKQAANRPVLLAWSPLLVSCYSLWSSRVHDKCFLVAVERVVTGPADVAGLPVCPHFPLSRNCPGGFRWLRRRPSPGATPRCTLQIHLHCPISRADLWPSTPTKRGQHPKLPLHSEWFLLPLPTPTSFSDTKRMPGEGIVRKYKAGAWPGS